jgi:hypothetical protein
VVRETYSDMRGFRTKAASMSDGAWLDERPSPHAPSAMVEPAATLGSQSAEVGS